MRIGRHFQLLFCCWFMVGCAESATSPAPGTPTTTASTEVVWQPLRPSEGRFSVVLPGNPVDCTQDPKKFHAFTILMPGGVEYTVGWSDHADEVATLGPVGALRAAGNAHIQGQQILRDKPMTIHGKPAREIVTLDSDNDVCHCRLILADNRLYQLLFLAPKAKYSETDKNLAKFLESFQLTD